MRIVIEGDGLGCSWNVLVDGKYLADGLTKDECLGCVASVLYGSGPPQFAKPIQRLTPAARDLVEREVSL
jgi:hypothetical protein